MNTQAPKKPSASERLSRLISSSIREARARSDVIIALAIRGGAVLAGFAVTFLIGRSFGAAANGQFALVTQTATFFAAVGLLGLDVSVVRHFAKSMAQNAKIHITAFAQVTCAGIGLMVAIAIGLSLGGDLVWHQLFGDTVPRGLLLVLCVLLVGRGASNLFSGLLRSQHRFALGQIIAALLIPLTTAAALVTGLAGSVEEALWATALGGIGAVLVGALAMTRHVGRGPGALSFPLRAVAASALPLWGVGVAMNIGDWYGLAVAARMLSATDAGLYRVAVQLAATLQIVSVALFSVYSAKISTAFHAGNLSQLALLARSAVRTSAAASLPLALVLIFGSEFMLAQIGPEFAPALPVVFILVAGQLAQTLTGPCGLVLAMSGNEKINLAITLFSTALLLLCVPVSAHLGGLPGIAVCISALMLLRNIFAYWVVRRKLGISIWAGTVHPINKSTGA